MSDKMMLIARKVAGEFDGMIDDFITAGKEPKFGVHLKAYEVPAAAAKLIPAFYVKTIDELKEVLKGEDEQLVEGYSNLTKPQVRKLIKHYESITEVCAQQEVSSKKSRRVKEKPASVLAKSVKYLKEDTDLELKSVRPENIVGSSEVRILNTKYKKIQVYRAEQGAKLSVKGTTITGYSVTDSGAKTLRKLENAKEFVSMNRKSFEGAFSKLTTKAQAVNGRINSDCIILKVI